MLRHRLAGALVVFLIFGVASLAGVRAQTLDENTSAGKSNILYGRIVLYNVNTEEMVLSVSDTGDEITFKAARDLVGVFGPGDSVKVRFETGEHKVATGFNRKKDIIKYEKPTC